MTEEAKSLLKKIEELREPPNSMSLREISTKLGEPHGRVCGLYYRNLSKKRFEKRGRQVDRPEPSAPRRFSWENQHENQ